MNASTIIYERCGVYDVIYYKYNRDIMIVIIKSIIMIRMIVIISIIMI